MGYEMKTEFRSGGMSLALRAFAQPPDVQRHSSFLLLQKLAVHFLHKTFSPIFAWTG